MLNFQTTIETPKDVVSAFSTIFTQPLSTISERNQIVRYSLRRLLCLAVLPEVITTGGGKNIQFNITHYKSGVVVKGDFLLDWDIVKNRRFDKLIQITADKGDRHFGFKLGVLDTHDTEQRILMEAVMGDSEPLTMISPQDTLDRTLGELITIMYQFIHSESVDI